MMTTTTTTVLALACAALSALSLRASAVRAAEPPPLPPTSSSSSSSTTPPPLPPADASTPASADGASTDGATTDGASTDGASTDGASTDGAAAAASAPPAEERPAKETHCSDGIDDDGDSVTDCGDIDCHDDPVCKPDGKAENTPERCSDWIDDDKDGATDCDDSECMRLPICQGSWRGPVDGNGEGGDVGEGGNAPARKLAPGVEAADSADGIGFVGVRFGVVASVLQELNFDNTLDEKNYATELDTRINLLQLRAFGQLPYLEDSYFLINIRGDVSPRLTYAMFQMPIGGGHYVNVNTGGGSLSNSLIISAAKQPLLEPAFWMTSAFEQGNSAALEFTGPIVPGVLRYRGFAGGGAGLTQGNVGNRHFQFENLNYTYTVGAQLQASAIGNYDRFDSLFLYKEVPLSLGVVLGAKYDQREQERFPAVNGLATFRWGRFVFSAEDYAKAELNFGAIQNAYDVTVGALIVPEWLFFAVDAGQFYTSDFGALQDVTGGAVQVLKPPKSLGADLRAERGETDVRAALHFFFWKNNGVISARYALQLIDPTIAIPGRKEPIVTHAGWLAAQFRF